MYDRVVWPSQYDLRFSALYALNDIDVKAPPEVVWKLLVDGEMVELLPAGEPGHHSQWHVGTYCRRKVQPGDRGFPRDPARDGVRALPAARMGNRC